MKCITYAIYDAEDDGPFVVSRVDNKVAWPVLDFAGIGMGGLEKSTGTVYEKGDFRGPTNYDLQAILLHEIKAGWLSLKWTRKIAVSLKNKHREFWGMKPLKERL